MVLYTEQSQIYCVGGKGQRRFQTGESTHFSEYKGRLSDSWLVNEASKVNSQHNQSRGEGEKKQTSHVPAGIQILEEGINVSASRDIVGLVDKAG